MTNVNTYSFLDLARWLSAWAVFLGHLRNHIFPAASEFTYSNPAIKAFVFFTLFGRSAVIVFFVLSGYLVGGRLLRTELNANTLRDYCVARVTRLYMVLIPALALIFSFAALRYYFSDGTERDILSYEYSLEVLFINLGFLQTIIGPQYGHDYPLWSLANEL